MDFKDYIEKYRNMIYEKICEYVPIGDEPGASNIMRDYIDRQGSYRRPGLVMLTGQMFGASIDRLILPAAAEQLSEDWILLQDDTEDDSELRRGKPAAQKLYGWIHAFNASNIGHIAMWRMLKDYMKLAGLDNGSRMFEKFYDMLLYTVKGQHIENEFIHYTKNLGKANQELYLRIVDSKTCYYTVYGPMQIGAIAAEQPDRVLSILKEIGTPVGVAFQIIDDVLDMTADEKKFGKKRYGDLYEGKVTLIMLDTYKKATPAEREEIDRIYAKKRAEKSSEEINFLIGLVEKYGSIDYAKHVAFEYGQKATEALAKHEKDLPDNEYKHVLLSALEELYVRDK
ncbi:MAG: polyprenyl synthetase family protein [Candidatus Micrarchaeia archaeon]